MKILITGGAGFIGSWLTERALAEGHQIVVVDNLSPQIHGALPQLDAPALTGGHAGLQFIRADVREAEQMDQALKGVDAVVHLAAETGTGQSMYKIAHYYEVNVQATARLLELIATRHPQVGRVVLASSRSVYGEGAYLEGSRVVVPPSRSQARLAEGLWEPVGAAGQSLRLVATAESAPVHPSSMYAATKLANEQMGRVFAEAYGKNVTALRFQNVYGARQSLRNPYTGILSIFSNRMRQNLPINLFEDGQPSRDFVYVTDVVESIMLALGGPAAGFDVLNVGSGEATSILRIATELSAALGSRSELTVTGDYRAGDIRHCYADLALVRERLGFEPAVGLSEGVARFSRWVLTQPVEEDRSAMALREMSEAGLGKAG